MSSAEKRSHKSWRLVVEAGYGPKGDRLRERRTITITDPKLLKLSMECERFADAPKKLKAFLDKELMKFQIEVESGEYISPEKMFFASFIEEWKKKFVQKHLEYKTIENYLFHCNKRIVPHFGNMKLNQVKTLHIIDYLDKLSDEGHGSATIVYNYRVLRSIFTKAAEWRVIEDNPMDGVKKPKEEKKLQLDVYDEQEATELFQALQYENIRLRVMVTLALTTGMRRGEILGLEWPNIDLSKGVIKVIQSIPAYKEGQPVIKAPKNKSSIRQVAVPPSVLAELKNYRKAWLESKATVLKDWKGGNREFLFCNFEFKQSCGLPFYPKTLSDHWRDFHKRHNLRYIRFHDLRHTSATLLINQGVHAKIISERLGHANIGTTMNVYGHVIQKADQAAANLFDEIIAK